MQEIRGEGRNKDKKEGRSELGGGESEEGRGV